MFDSLVKKTEELSGQMLAAQNTSKELQEAYQKTNKRLIELERQQQTWTKFKKGLFRYYWYFQ